LAGSVFPGRLGGEAFVEACKCEGTEGECGKGAALFFFPLAIGFAEGVRLVEQVVVCEVWFGGQVVDEYDLMYGQLTCNGKWLRESVKLQDDP
jgi:hypothetical protein